MSYSVSALLLFLLKSSLVSGLLYGYYRLFLRNRVFHQYNRCYLMGVILVSLILPLVPLPAFFSLPHVGGSPVLSGAIHAITPGEWAEGGILTERAESEGSERGLSGGYPGQGYPVLRAFLSAWQTWVWGIYLLIAAVSLYRLLRQLRYVRRLRRKYPSGQKIDGIRLFLTNEPGTPFSFGHTLFWNEEIDIDSTAGRQVFRHELFHIRQQHTLDLLLMKAVLVVCWPVPFFYLIYREIRTIHEYLADRHAISDDDRYQYAELLVWHTVYKQPLSLLHPFFQSPIKRRITMITQLKPTTPGYISRAMVLPVLLFLMCAFAGPRPTGSRDVRKASVAVRNASAGAAVLTPFTVIIDAGHGGMDAGAVSKTGAVEKNINLALALKVKQLSAEYHVHVLLTREDDELAGGKRSIRESLIYRTAMAKENRADLFVSLHTDADGSRKGGNGFQVYVSPDNQHYPACVQYGSDLIDALKADYTTGQDLKESKEHVRVLRETAMPAVLVLCGNISHPSDLAYISSVEGQEKIARDILRSIQKFEERTR